MQNDYDQVAPYYDLTMESLGRANLEAELWVALASRFGDPILEVGCGTGRLLAKLLTHTVSGIDSSQAMLTIARAHLPSSILLYHGDMRSFTVPDRFALIAFPASQIQHLQEPCERVSTLKCARRHLLVSGVIGVSISSIGDKSSQSGWTTIREDDARLEVCYEESMSSRKTTIRLVHGLHVRQFGWQLFRVSPDELKTEASNAGLELAETIAESPNKSVYILRSRP